METGKSHGRGEEGGGGGERADGSGNLGGRGDLNLKILPRR